MEKCRGMFGGLFTLFTVVGLTALTYGPARAHCDGLDGPVVKAAQEALAKGDINLVLLWVKKDDESQVRHAFDETLVVRKQGGPAKDLADRYFFETLVRLHRAGEGAPYDGLKPAGRDLGPAIPAADQSLKSGDVGPITSLLIERIRAGILERYEKAMSAKSFDSRDVEAGRRFVEAYVAYLHYVEALHEAATSPVSGHHPEEAMSSHNH